MFQFLSLLKNDEQGQDIAEYAVLLAVVLTIAIVAIMAVGHNATETFNKTADCLKNPPGPTRPTTPSN